MEDLLYFVALASPPFLAALLVWLRSKSLTMYWVVLFLLAAPIILYFVWASKQLYIDSKAPITVIGGAFLTILSITLPLTSIWFIRRIWLKVMLAPLLYLFGLFIALVVGIEFGMFQK